MSFSKISRSIVTHNILMYDDKHIKLKCQGII